MKTTELVMDLERERRGEEPHADLGELAEALELRALQLHLTVNVQAMRTNAALALRNVTVEQLSATTEAEMQGGTAMKTETVIRLLEKSAEGAEIPDGKELAHALMVKAEDYRRLKREEERREGHGGVTGPAEQGPYVNADREAAAFHDRYDAVVSGPQEALAA